MKSGPRKRMAPLVCSSSHSTEQIQALQHLNSRSRSGQIFCSLSSFLSKQKQLYPTDPTFTATVRDIKTQQRQLLSAAKFPQKGLKLLLWKYLRKTFGCPSPLHQLASHFFSSLNSVRIINTVIGSPSHVKKMSYKIALNSLKVQDRNNLFYCEPVIFIVFK